MVIELWRAVEVVTYREFLRFLQERARMVAAFAFPLLYLLVFGAGFQRAAGSLTPGVDYLRFMYPGVIALMVLQSALSTGTSIVWERQMRLLRTFLVAPMSRAGVLLGKVVWAMLLGLFQTAVMLAAAPLLGIHITPLLALELVPLVAGLALWLAAFGLLLGCWVESVQAYQAWMQFASFPLIFTAGVFYPLRGVPLWLRIVAGINPATYGVDAVRRVFLGGALGDGQAARSLGLALFGHQVDVPADIVVIAAVGLAVMTAALYSFRLREAAG